MEHGIFLHFSYVSDRRWLFHLAQTQIPNSQTPHPPTPNHKWHRINRKWRRNKLLHFVYALYWSWVAFWNKQHLLCLSKHDRTMFSSAEIKCYICLFLLETIGQPPESCLHMATSHPRKQLLWSLIRTCSTSLLLPLNVRLSCTSIATLALELSLIHLVFIVKCAN